MPDSARTSSAVWRAVKAVAAGLARAGKGIGWVVSRVILSVVYFVVFTPMALILTLLRKDPMQRRLDPEAETYFTAVESEDFDPARCRRLY